MTAVTLSARRSSELPMWLLSSPRVSVLRQEALVRGCRSDVTARVGGGPRRYSAMYITANPTSATGIA